jgi:hypothetical protein
VEKIAPAGKTDFHLFFFDGKQAQLFSKDDVANIANNRVAARLYLGDPPIGWGGR